MNQLRSIKNNSMHSEGYKIIIDSIKQSELFETFEEAFVAFHNYIQTRPAWNLDRLEKGMWIEMINKDTGEVISSKGLFDCLDLAKKIGILSSEGKLVNTEYPAMTKIVNKCFAKSTLPEYLEKQ